MGDQRRVHGVEAEAGEVGSSVWRGKFDRLAQECQVLSEGSPLFGVAQAQGLTAGPSTLPVDARPRVSAFRETHLREVVLEVPAQINAVGGPFQPRRRSEPSCSDELRALTRAAQTRRAQTQEAVLRL